MGGEEFAVLLPGMTPAEAIEAAERLRRAVEVLEVMVNGAAVGITISVGVAAGGRADSALLMARADAALYSAKGGGRNRVIYDCLEPAT
jgi:diguanylate cyclase (GGDEF)-like protein